MSIKVKPKRLCEQTRAWVPDQTKPDEYVVYTFMPISKSLAMNIAGVNIYDDADNNRVPDRGGASYDTVGLSVKSIEGLEDVNESGESTPFTLEFTTRKFGDKEYQRITDEKIEQLPDELFYHMLANINTAASLTAEELENINFTPRSQPTALTGASNATERSETGETPEVSLSAHTSTHTNLTEKSDPMEALKSDT